MTEETDIQTPQREVVDSATAGSASDGQLLDFLDALPRQSYWHSLSVHDSRDMGYTKNFVTVTISGPRDQERSGKGDSFRQTLAALINGQNTKLGN